MPGIEDSELRSRIHRDLLATAQITSARAMAQRQAAARALREAERLQKRMRELLEQAHSDRRDIARKLEAAETAQARESHARARELQQRAESAHASAKAARSRAPTMRRHGRTRQTRAPRSAPLGAQVGATECANVLFREEVRR